MRAPMLALLAELEAEFGEGKLFRPYRDVRFSKDKTPYKTNAAITVGDGHGAGRYLSLGADGLFVGGGYYHTASDQVERLRRAVADDVQGPALERVLAAAGKAGFAPHGERLSRLPKGYPADHPRADLLRHKSLTLHRQWEPEPWLHTRAALDPRPHGVAGHRPADRLAGHQRRRQRPAARAPLTRPGPQGRIRCTSPNSCQR